MNNDLPNPSADEEVERLAAKWVDLHSIPADAQWRAKLAIRDAIHEATQQHNADREKLRHLRAVKEAWDDAYANHDGDVLKQTVAALKAELQQLRASLAEKEMALNEQMVMRSQDVKTRDELIESMADTAKQWEDRYAKLQSELATAQNTIESLKNGHHAFVETHRRAIETSRALRTQIASLTRQLQSAMEERDALIAAAKCQNEFEVLVEKESYKNLRPDEVKRLEELQAVMNKAADIVEPMTPPTALLSRLSTSRSTENKT